MTQLLAQASPDPAALKQWLEVLAYLCGIVLAIAGVWKLFASKPGKTEISNQPLSVKAAHDFVTQRDHERLEAKMDEELGRERGSRKKMHEEIARLQGDVRTLGTDVNSAKASVAKVEAKLDANANLTARIDGKVEQINQTVHSLNSALTQFMRDNK